MSSEFTRSGSGLSAIKVFYQATEAVARTLAIMFETLLPEEYLRYKTAFDAGVWMEEDPGPWLGRAIVYKLQVSLHHDKNDEGPSACFPCGRFTGGALKIPQLNAKFW